MKYKLTFFDEEVEMYTNRDIFSKRKEHLLVKLGAVLIVSLVAAITTLEKTGVMNKLIDLAY